ncbi:hypothetical protein O3G_MSEX004320 [Manduca sexta]|uniref:Uncharacterized protein n=1 Tax=Manduca sexta TaxID=7130 RepID=A0A921YV07_MANSE|nr:hypothetical protein O3G_MSEX004320 [Manduca sexta]
MFYLFIILLFLPSISHQLTIQVQGRVQVGDALSELLQDICKNIFEKAQVNSQRPTLTPGKNLENSKPNDKTTNIYTSQNEKTNNKGSNYVNIYTADNYNNVRLDKNRMKPAEDKEISLLDEIIGKHDLGKVHIYGKHDKKAERYQRPLNNINV